MQVAEQKGEEGEFVYYFAEVANEVVVLDDARGTPPPPKTFGNPACLLGRVNEVFDVQPCPEIGGEQYATLTKNFKEAFEVGDEEKEERGEESVRSDA